MMILHKMGTSSTMRSTVSKVTIIHCSLSVEKCFSQNSIYIVSCFFKVIFIVYSKFWSNKVIKNTHHTSFLPFALLYTCMCICLSVCVCVSSCKMRGGRTFLSVAPCLHCPTVTEITGCSRTDCSWILNWSFWLLWIKNSLQVVQASAMVDSLQGLPCKVAYRVQQCKGRVDKHVLCLIRPNT